MVRSKVPILKQIDIIFLALFFVSFLNSLLATLFCLLLLLYVQLGVEGEIKALLLLTLRGVLSSAVAAPIGNGLVKLGVLLLLSVLILLSNGGNRSDLKKSNNIIGIAVLFAVLVAFSSLIVSSYPITALFKMISFIIPFCAIMKGVAITKNSCNWTDYLTIAMSILMGISLILLPFPQFRIINSAFQGIFNHVN